MNNLLVTMLDLAGVPGVEKLRRQHRQSSISDRTLMRFCCFAASMSAVRAVCRPTCACSMPIKRRDHKAVTTLMSAKADVNAAQPDGATALAWAAYLDDRDTAEALLKAGAKVETADEYGETPLTLACATGDAVLVEKLLDSRRECECRALERRDRADDRRQFRQRRCGEAVCSTTAPTSTPPNRPRDRPR